jgi:hypothetical protein
MKIIIFDWVGTLDHKADVEGYLANVRATHPECYLILHTGMLGVPRPVLDAFDCVASKTQLRSILKEVISEFDHWCKVSQPLPMDAVEEVIVIDDQLHPDEVEDLNCWLTRHMVLFQVKGYFSTREWEQAL